MPTKPKKVGHVSERRYQELVERALKLMETITSCQFAIGDMAVQIEPVHERPGGIPSGVYESLRHFANDIAVEFETLLAWRYVANAWPKSRRVKHIPFGVYKQLAGMQPEAKRFATIKGEPPTDPRTGQRRWTWDTAGRVAGHTPTHPVSKDEKVNKIHDLARDDHVAATAVSDMLRRPDVAHRVLADPTSRHMLYRAHRDRAEEIQQVARDRTTSIRPIERQGDVLELLGACAAFVSAMNRHIPKLSGVSLTPQQEATVRDNLDRVHAAEDWCRTVIDTGDASMDEQLAKLLRGDGS